MTGTSYLSLSGIANVVEFGADNSGVGDAAVGIGRAIAQVGVLGGIVEIPPGTYRLGSSPSFGNATLVTIYRHPGVTFTGVGSMPAASGNNVYFAPGGSISLNTLFFTPAASKIVPGATSLSIRNNADVATNLSISNAGIFVLTPQTGPIGATASIQLGTTLNTIHQPDATSTNNFVRILQNFDSSAAGSPGGGVRAFGEDVHWIDNVNGLNTFAGAYVNAFHDGSGSDIQDFMGVIGRAYISNGGTSSVGMWGVRGDFNFTGAATVAKAVSVYGHLGSQFAGSTITVAAMVYGDHVDWTGGTVVQDAYTAYFGIPSGATGYNIGVSIGNEPASPSPTPWSAGLRVWDGGAVFTGGPTIPLANTSSKDTTVYLQSGSAGGANTTLDLLYFYRSNVTQGYIGFDADTSTFAGHVKLVTNMSIMSKNLICDNNGQLWSASTIFANAMQIIPAITTSGALLASFTWTGAAHTTKTPGNIAELNWNANRTVGFDGTGGTFASTYTYQFQRPIYTAGAATTWTLAATMRIVGAPSASTNVTFTNTFALYVDSGNSSFGGSIIQNHSPSAINTTNTATAAVVLTGYITSTSAAPTTITLPTGTLLGAALDAAQGTIFDLTIDNTAGASTVTIAVAVNGILSADAVANAGSAGLLTIPSGVTGQGIFRLMFSSATAYTFSRVG